MRKTQHRGRANGVGVSAAEALIHGGALIEVAFSPHPDEVPILAREGIVWEHAIHRMMIDTGAALTVVEEAVPRFLGLEPIRFQEIRGVGGDLECPVYRLGITIGFADAAGRQNGVTLASDVVAIPTSSDVELFHVGLLGRHFLQFVRLEYDGPRGEYVLVHETTEDVTGVPSVRDIARKERRKQQKRSRRKNRGR